LAERRQVRPGKLNLSVTHPRQTGGKPAAQPAGKRGKMMKINKAWCLVLMIAVLMGGSAVAGQAASSWYTCQVDGAGPITATTGARIFLTDTAEPPAFQNQEFQVPRGRENQFLAVALEAISQGRKVKVSTDPNKGTIPTVSAIYLQAQ